MQAIANNLAENLIHLRKKKSWSQNQLAQAADIPRTTVTNMETGAANPSLNNLIKISNALKVGIEELLTTSRKEYQLIRAADIACARKKTGNATLYKLLPDKIRGMEIDKLVLQAGQYMVGTPHIVGTKEYFYCIAGKIEITIQGENIFY